MAWSQSPWLIREDPAQITFEWFRPAFDSRLDNNDEISLLSSVLFMTTRYPVNDRFSMLAELPMSHWQFKDGDGIDVQEPHTTIGNIYLGGEYSYSGYGDDLFPFLEFGMRLPSMPQPEFPDKRGYYTGFVGSVDRREAFFNDMLAINAINNLDYRVNEKTAIRIRGGFSYWIYTGDFRLDNQLYLIQGLQVRTVSDKHSAYFGFTGKYNVLSNSTFSGDDNTQFTVGFNKYFSGWMGGFFVRAPVNENHQLLLVYGLMVNINM